MTVAGFALRHGPGLVFLALAAAALGVYAALALPKGVYPEVSFPREQVIATLPGASGGTLLVGVTRPLEAALAGVPGVERVRSRTIRGAVDLSLFFSPDTDMAQAHQFVIGAVAEARSSLPPGVDLVAERVLPSGFPILSYNVEGPYPPQRLYELAEYTLRPAMSGLPGVGRVEAQASEIPEVAVDLDPGRLAAAHLTVPMVADRLRASNVVQAVARLSAEHQLSLGIVTGELTEPSQVADVVVGGTEEAPLRVADLGTVHPAIAPRTRVIRVDGKPGAILNIARRLGGDILKLDDAAHGRARELRPALPPEVKLVPTYEQADFVREAVAGVGDALFFGALFAVLVLALFLRSWRATALVALSLPLTLAAAILVLQALGQTLNLMTLGGLAVAVGLVIDDAVVVVEAVHAKLEAGLAPAEAARAGTDELFWPVVGTTVTTLVVFLPLSLLSGVAGQFFSALSLALSAAVLLSLPMSLLVLPPLAARFLRPFVSDAPAFGLRPSAGKAGLLPGRPLGERLAAGYARTLERTLSHRGWLWAAAALLLALTAVFAARLPSDFLPEADEGAYVIDYYAPVGASLAEADALAGRLEEIVRTTPEVAAFSRRLGAELGPPTATLSSSGDVAVRLKRSRSRSFDQIAQEQRQRIAAAVPGLRVEFTQVLADMLGDLQGSPEPIDVKLFGPDVSVLARLAGEAAPKIKDIPGLVDFFDGDEGCAPEQDLRVGQIRAGREGLTAAQIGDQLGGDYLGEVATQLRRPDHLEDVRVRLAGPEEPDVSALGSARVTASSGALVPLPAVVDITASCPPAQLLRENQRNYVHLTARLEGTSLGSAARAVRARLAGWRLPIGYSWELGGLVEQQQASQRSIVLVMLLALLLVTAVLLFQLRSGRGVMAILLAAPLGLTGGVAALAATGVSLNVASMMGAILLIGLVVKNGILLLDYSQGAEERGMPRHAALLAAARARLRPILMTTLATMAALLPMALGLGSGSALHRPLAIVVLGGLAFSTAATLFIVPSLMDRAESPPSG
ncbi:MAG: efflux RND transporter permease subunit [Myxococcales bacterium]